MMINKRILIPAIIGAVLVIIFLVASATQTSNDRVGKTAVTVQVGPNDAEVSVDGNKSSAGTLYLPPGEHTFKATKPGWEEKEKKVTVGEDPVEVKLVLRPFSEAAENWIAQNPQAELERELLAGQIANQEGEQLYLKNPIIDRLPYTTADYEITYREDKASPTGVVVMVLTTTTAGRTAALAQMRSWNQDPATLDIEYVGFVNPLRKSGGQ